jgi:hypothetical protein
MAEQDKDLHEAENRCPDCQVLPGSPHETGCDVAPCPACGWQRLQCDAHGDDESLDPLAVWTGRWPGEVECEREDWWSYFDQARGWIRCPADAPDASHDLNRLLEAAAGGYLVWSREQQEWVRPNADKLGARIREEREWLGATPAGLAHIADLPVEAITAFEAGERTPTDAELARLAWVLGLTIRRLYGAPLKESPELAAVLGENATAHDRYHAARFVEFLRVRDRPEPTGKEGE